MTDTFSRELLRQRVEQIFGPAAHGQIRPTKELLSKATILERHRERFAKF